MENANPNNNQPQQQQQQHEDENMVLDEDGVELDIRTSPEVRSLYPYGDDVR